MSQKQLVNSKRAEMVMGGKGFGAAVRVAAIVTLIALSSCVAKVTSTPYNEPDKKTQALQQHESTLSEKVSSVEINDPKTALGFLGTLAKLMGSPQVLSALEWKAYVAKNDAILRAGKNNTGMTLRLLDKLYVSGRIRDAIKTKIDLIDGAAIILLGATFIGDASSRLLIDHSEDELENKIVPDLIKGVGMVAGGSVAILMWAAMHQGDPAAKTIEKYFGALVGNRLPVLFNDNGLEKESLSNKLKKLNSKAIWSKKIFYLYQGMDRLSHCKHYFDLVADVDVDSLDTIDHLEQGIAYCGSGLSLVAKEGFDQKEFALPQALFDLAIFARSFDGGDGIPLAGPLIGALRKSILEEPAIARAEHRNALDNGSQVFRVWQRSWENGCRQISVRADCSELDANIEHQLRLGLFAARGGDVTPPYWPALNFATDGFSRLREKYLSMILMAYRGDRAKMSADLGINFIDRNN